MSDKYYRVNLDGKLESAVTLHMKRGPDGYALPEGHSRSEEDIASPDVQKAFKAEMAYWLKDWLKKQHRLVATSVNGATPEDGVRASAVKETKALDHEAAAAPAASAPAPTAP